MRVFKSSGMLLFLMILALILQTNLNNIIKSNGYNNY